MLKKLGSLYVMGRFQYLVDTGKEEESKEFLKENRGYMEEIQNCYKTMLSSENLGIENVNPNHLPRFRETTKKYLGLVEEVMKERIRRRNNY